MTGYSHSTSLILIALLIVHATTILTIYESDFGKVDIAVEHVCTGGMHNETLFTCIRLHRHPEHHVFTMFSFILVYYRVNGRDCIALSVLSVTSSLHTPHVSVPASHTVYLQANASLRAWRAVVRGSQAVDRVCRRHHNEHGDHCS